jgi:hypothetical protein
VTTPTQRIVAGQMSEKQLVKHIKNAAETFGWLFAHFVATKTKGATFTNVQGDNGSPDIILARRGVVLHIETKTQRGKLSEAQEQWRDAMGASWRQWKPEHWPDEITRELR